MDLPPEECFGCHPGTIFGCEVLNRKHEAGCGHGPISENAISQSILNGSCYNEIAVAYSEPNMKMIMTPIFSFVFSCVLQTMGIGSTKSTKSEIQLREP